ncbi:hypothetical protein KI387_026135, partial [Taxus chinensis]
MGSTRKCKYQSFHKIVVAHRLTNHIALVKREGEEDITEDKTIREVAKDHFQTSLSDDNSGRIETREDLLEVILNIGTEDMNERLLKEIKLKDIKKKLTNHISLVKREGEKDLTEDKIIREVAKDHFQSLSDDNSGRIETCEDLLESLGATFIEDTKANHLSASFMDRFNPPTSDLSPVKQQAFNIVNQHFMHRSSLPPLRLIIQGTARTGHLDLFPDSLLLLIFNKIANVKALSRHYTVLRHLNSLVPWVENVFIKLDNVISGKESGFGGKGKGILGKLVQLMISNIMKLLQALQHLIEPRKV